MELTPPRGLRNPEEEIANAHWPKIRLDLIGKAVSDHPLTELTSSWSECTPETMRNFSAAAYFFAREVYHKLHIPIGLVGAYYGGSNAQAWTRREVFESDPDLKTYVTEWQAHMPQESPAPSSAATGQRPTSDQGPNSRYRPANFYNAMIAPMIPLAIRGVLWYQGEANTGNARDAALYGKLFSAMIQDWRAQWGEGDFPFIFVQLPTSEPRYPEPTDSAWARVRESQQKALALKQAYMIVTLDIGEGAVVHAHNKKEVGERLATTALHEVYALHDIPDEYPMFSSMNIHGSKVTVHFNRVDGGLVCKNPKGLVGFAISGADRTFTWADAEIHGDTVVVSSPKIPVPLAVRYAWADNPEVSLFGKEGLPAAPFRTDDWPAENITNPRAAP